MGELLDFALPKGNGPTFDVDLAQISKDPKLRLKKLSNLLAELEGKLLKMDEMYLRGELEADSYKRLKGGASEDLNQVHREIERLMAMDTNFMK
jgi:hypothetical protein